MKTMKKVLVFIFVFLFVWTSESIIFAKNIKEIKVETINVQELDENDSHAALKRQYQQKIDGIKKVVDRTYVFKPINGLKKGDSSKVNMNSYHLVNEDYQLLKKSAINECSDPKNIRANNYVIKNFEKQINLDKTKFSYQIYQGDNKKCDMVLSVSNYGVSKATVFNSELYLELYNEEDDEKKELFKLTSAKKLVKIASTKEGITSYAKINEHFFYTYGGSLYLIKNNNQHFLVKNTTKDEIKSINYYNDKIYIIFQNERNKKTFVNEYDAKLDKMKKLNSLKQLKLRNTKELNFKERYFRNTIDYNVTSQSDNLIVFSNKLVCSKDYRRCKYLAVDGESIIGVANNYIIYASDRIYISDFFINSKDTLMEHTDLAVMSSTHENNDYLVIKVYNKKGDYQYIQYNLNDF